MESALGCGKVRGFCVKMCSELSGVQLSILTHVLRDVSVSANIQYQQQLQVLDQLSYSPYDSE